MNVADNLWQGFKTSDTMYQIWNICPCHERNYIYCIISTYHTLWNVLFLFLKRQRENLLCNYKYIYCHFNCLTTQNQFPNTYSSDSKMCISNIWREYIKCEIISMIRLVWNIQVFRIPIRTAMIYYLQQQSNTTAAKRIKKSIFSYLQFTVKVTDSKSGRHWHQERPNVCTEVTIYTLHHLLTIRLLLIVVGNTEQLQALI